MMDREYYKELYIKILKKDVKSLMVSGGAITLYGNEAKIIVEKIESLEAELSKARERIKILEDGINNLPTYNLEEIGRDWHSYMIMEKHDGNLRDDYCGDYVETDALKKLLTPTTPTGDT